MRSRNRFAIIVAALRGRQVETSTERYRLLAT